MLEFYEDLSGNQIANPHVTPALLDPVAIRKLRLDFRDIQALDALNDDDFDKKVPERVPSGLPVGGNVR